MQLPTFAAIKAFIPFCRLSRNPADLAAAGAVNVLEVRLTDAACSRIFAEMEAAQVFSQNFPLPAGGGFCASRDWRRARTKLLYSLFARTSQAPQPMCGPTGRPKGYIVRD